MKILFRSLSCFLLSSVLNTAIAQIEISTESPNPPDINWRYVKNENSRIIFPKELTPQAERIASIVDYLAKNTKSSISTKALQVPILLHGRSMYPNAFVATVPFRSEFFSSPMPDWSQLGQNNWLDLLAIHEYRHVLQSSGADVGFTHLARIFTGRLGWSTSQFLTTPNWFSEGDAVVSETLQTSSGRGRLPSFTAEQRAQFHENLHFKYPKIRNGSYKIPMPSHYPLGYQLALYGRSHYSNDAWAAVLRQANFYRPLFYPFSGAMKNMFGMRPKEMTAKAYDELEKISLEVKNSQNLKEAIDVSPSPDAKDVFYLTYPYRVNDSTLYARYGAYHTIPHLVKIKGSEIEKLKGIGSTRNTFMSYSPFGALWLENQPNPRWANVDYTRVVYYDFDKKEKQYLMDKKRIQYAAIAPDTTSFLTFEIENDLSFSIHRYNLHTAEKLSSLTNENGYELAYPVFDSSASYVYYFAKHNGLISLFKHNIATDSRIQLTDWLNHLMVEPTVDENYVYFRASFNGIDNIYAVDKTGNKNIFKVTSEPVEASTPYVSGNSELIFSSLTAYGSKIKVSDTSKEAFTPIDPTEMKVYDRVNSLSENGDLLTKVPEKDYEEKNFNGLFKGWRFHSYGAIPSYSTTSNTPSISSAQFFILMNDLLDANSLGATYTRYLNERQNGLGINYTMAKFYVKAHLGYQLRGRAAVENGQTDEFNEQQLNVGLSLPLNWLKGTYSYSTNFATGYNLLERTESKTTENSGSRFTFYNTSWSGSVLKRTAYQHLQPRWGASLNANLQKSFVAGQAQLFQGGGKIYLPGIGKNHGVLLSVGTWLEPANMVYKFPSTFGIARGINLAEAPLNAFSTAFTYKLPLFYPDWGINGLTYLKRLRANFFLDYGKAYYNDNSSIVGFTTGVELKVDQVIFNLAEIPTGLRFGYQINNQTNALNQPFFINIVFGD